VQASARTRGEERCKGLQLARPDQLAAWRSGVCPSAPHLHRVPCCSPRAGPPRALREIL